MKKSSIRLACVFIILMFFTCPLAAIDINQDENNKYINQDDRESITDDAWTSIEAVEEINDTADNEKEGIDADSGIDNETNTLDDNKTKPVDDNGINNVKESKDLNLSELEPDDYDYLTIHVDDITEGQSALVEVHTLDFVSVGVFVVFEGHSTFLWVDHGYASTTIDGLKPGTYSIKVVVQDNQQTNSTTFRVKEKDIPNLSVEADDIYPWEKPVVKVHGDKGFSDTVKVSCPKFSSEYEIDVKNGYGEKELDESLSTGNYDVKVKYDGGTYYLADESIGKLTVKSKYDPNLSVEVEDILPGEKPVVKVHANESVSGKVKVSCPKFSSEYEIDVKNGYGEKELDESLSPAYYQVTVKYDGDTYYLADECSTNFKMDGQKDPDLRVEMDDIYYFETPVVKVYADEHVNGVVLIQSDDFQYPYGISISDGYSEYNLLEKLEPGEYTVHATFYENDEWAGSNFTTTLTVKDRLDPDFRVEIEDANYGEHPIARIYSSPEFDNVAKLKINGSNEVTNIKMSDGFAQCKINQKLPIGNYTATVSFDGNDTCKPCESSTQFAINKIDSNLRVYPHDIDEGEVETIKVVMDDLAKGTVHIAVNSSQNDYLYECDTFYDSSSGNNGIVNIPDLPYGSYSVSATYNGDENFNGAVANGSFEVADIGINPHLILDVNDTTPGKSTELMVCTKMDYTGDITIKLDGKEMATVKTENGYAWVSLNEDLKPGQHIIEANSSATDSYIKSRAKKTFNVFGVPELDVQVNDIVKGEDLNVRVNTSKYYNGLVVCDLDHSLVILPKEGFAVNGEYNCTFNGTCYWNGQKWDSLSPGKHTMYVYLVGDEGFLPAQKEVSFNVKSADS